MNGGVKAALLVSCLTLAGCSTDGRGVKVRAIADPSAVLSNGGDELAVARGQFVLGNVGLALEGFRKAQRANPSDPAALAGIGDCYSAMGRFDIAQSSYESALALAPHDARLLLALADIFDREGKPELGIAARAEAAVVPQAAAPVAVARAPAVPQAAAPVAVAQTVRRLPSPPAPPEVQVPRPSLGSVTVELPPARPVERMQAQAAPLRPVEIAPEAIVQAVPALPATHTAPTVTPARVETAEIPRPALGSVTVELPPARPAERVDAEPAELPAAEIATAFAEPPTLSAVAAQTSRPADPLSVDRAVEIPRPSLVNVAIDLPTARPAEHVAAQPIQAATPRFEADAPDAPALPERRPLPRRQVPDGGTAVALAPAPRLERLTSGEVALVTTGKPLWQSSNVQTASGSTVRWVALASAPDRPNVQILNAARSQGLAASARTVLLDRGWRKIAVGDAPALLHKSVVLFPKSRKALGRRLAAQFGVSAQMTDRKDVVLILGRDALDRIAAQRRS